MEAKIGDNQAKTELVDEVFDAAKDAEPMLKKFVVRLIPALCLKKIE